MSSNLKQLKNQPQRYGQPVDYCPPQMNEYPNGDGYHGQSNAITAHGNVSYVTKEPVTYNQPQRYGQPVDYCPPPMNEHPNGYGYHGKPNAITTHGNVSYITKEPLTYSQPERYGKSVEYCPPQINEHSNGYGYHGQPNAITTQWNVSDAHNAPVTNDQPLSFGQLSEYPPPQMHEHPSGFGYPGQPNIIRTQGNVSYVSPNTVIVTHAGRPPNLTGLAIFACIFCCWPIGVCAIVYANQSQSTRNNDVAWSKYRTSRTLSIVSIVLGLIWIAVAIWNFASRNNTNQYY